MLYGIPNSDMLQVTCQGRSAGIIYDGYDSSKRAQSQVIWPNQYRYVRNKCTQKRFYKANIK